MLVGYMRVSSDTDRQTTDRQRDALFKARPPTPTGARARSHPALHHGVRHHAQDLEHEIGPIEGGVARGVERGRHLTHIPSNELQPSQPPQHHLRIPHAQPPRFRRPGAYGVDGIEPIDVEGNITQVAPYRVPRDSGNN
jgi:hypothetical protein